MKTPKKMNPEVTKFDFKKKSKHGGKHQKRKENKIHQIGRVVRVITKSDLEFNKKKTRMKDGHSLGEKKDLLTK